MTSDNHKNIPEDPKRAYEQGYHDGLQDGYLKGFKAVVNLIMRVLTEIKP